MRWSPVCSTCWVALRLRHTPRVAWLLGLAGAWACASGALLLALALRLRAARGARTQAPRPERRVHPDRRAAPAP
ncbi:hypothetical protein [Massilia sp. X63]|uniref:hypothetical protein n=1 Tax=Massilia sp. X63 TaxID=3237285 RepID=UPI0034DD2ADC